DEFSLIHPLRVRWGECDAQGIVFNVNYFLYFDVGMTEWLRALGYDPASGIEFFTVHAEADYRAPARMDEMIDVCARCARIGRSSMTIATAIFRGAALLTEGQLVYAHAERGGRTASLLPESFITKVEAFEKTPPQRKALA
ncbi:MAG: thioesterase family protein, partial [Pseudomonadota bacterium]